ncbi:MAG: YfiR family protein [Bacteroidales bacterium]|nr:YfiR family protein [Bacteroidales bacterium]
MQINRYIKLFCLGILFLSRVVLPSKMMGQASEHLIKAGFIEKFTHFVEWPVSTRGEDRTMKISIIGKSRIEPAIRDIFGKTNNPNVSIVNISAVQEIGDSKIVFVSNTLNQELLKEVVKYAAGKPVMTISDSKGYCEKGILLNMVIVDNYVRYEINKKVLDLSGLKMSSLLLNSAIIIEK